MFISPSEILQAPRNVTISELFESCTKNYFTPHFVTKINTKLTFRLTKSFIKGEFHVRLSSKKYSNYSRLSKPNLFFISFLRKAFKGYLFNEILLQKEISFEIIEVHLEN